MDSLERAAHHLDCTIENGTPTGGRWGEYNPRRHAIVLLHTLAPVQRWSTLAHELGHAAHRHIGTCPRQETEADQFGHWLTIPLCTFLRATQAYDSVQDVAMELGVMPVDIRAYTGRFRHPRKSVPPGDNTSRTHPQSAV